ncbi:MAG: DinB family protein [Chloroflexota bacterium]
MTIGIEIANNLHNELTLSREIIGRLPTELLDWKPHPKSPSAGELSVHITDMFEWIKLAATSDELDYASKSFEVYRPHSTNDLLDYFDRSTNGAAAAVAAMSDSYMRENWIVRNGDRIFFSRPREEVIRVDCLHHVIHHRGQLTVYFRLNDIILPGVYGPNSEE